MVGFFLPRYIYVSRTQPAFLPLFLRSAVGVTSMRDRFVYHLDIRSEIPCQITGVPVSDRLACHQGMNH